MSNEQIVYSVSDLVGYINQTLDYAYPIVTVVGELSSFQISKQKWVYADLKDDQAKLRLFGTVYMLHTPVEDGMLVEVVARPQLHPLYGFSLQLQSIRPVGEGSIKKSATILEQKLEKEGLFAVERKRQVPQAPARIGLVASKESAAYADFIKIMNARWNGVEVEHVEVQVQGELAVSQLAEAVQFFNQQADPVEVIVLIRGGGCADDLAAFSTETVTRAVAASRILTVIAIGHEIDVSLAERAADLAASTPSNAAELLFPDKKEVASRLKQTRQLLQGAVQHRITRELEQLAFTKTRLQEYAALVIDRKQTNLLQWQSLLNATHPKNTLSRGFAIITTVDGRLITSVRQLKAREQFTITLQDGEQTARVEEV